MEEQKELTIYDVINTLKKNRKKVNSKLIVKAYTFAKTKHADQKRLSGQSYIIHPLNVASILSEINLDDETICAAILHDVVEDTDVSKEEIEAEFGAEIAEMVDGVTKLGKLQYTSKEEEQVENYRKMFLAMGKDIRVILIKLADRLHNMRTLKYLKRERQIANSRETMDLYAPLANRLRYVLVKMGVRRFSF